MTKLGLTFLLETDDMSSVLTTVHLPSHVHIDQLRHSLREHSIIIYEGKGPLAGRIFQVGNIGELSQLDIKRFLRALGDALSATQRETGLGVEQPLHLSPAPAAVPV
jgi:2-aminoethylphosphonate-pyruvate transaminase